MDLVVPTGNGDRYQVRARHGSVRVGNELMRSREGRMGWIEPVREGGAILGFGWLGVGVCAGVLPFLRKSSDVPVYQNDFYPVNEL